MAHRQARCPRAGAVRRLKAATEPIMSQTLLEPMAVELSPEDCAAVLEQLPLLERYGFRCEDFGAARCWCGRCPSVWGRRPHRSPGGAGGGPAAEPGGLDRRRDSLLQTMACKSAIKAGCTPTPLELRRLVDRVQSGGKFSMLPMAARWR